MSSKISDDFFSHQPLFQNLLLCIFISLSLFLLFMYFSKNSSLDHWGAKNGFCIPHLNYWGARARPTPPESALMSVIPSVLPVLSGFHLLLLFHLPAFPSVLSCTLLLISGIPCTQV